MHRHSSKYTENDWFFFSLSAALHIIFSPFLVCQGMTCVCSLSLLLAWKGISKLLWQDAGIIALVSWLPSCLAVELNRVSTRTCGHELIPSERKWTRVFLASTKDNIIFMALIYLVPPQKIDLFSTALVPEAYKTEGGGGRQEGLLGVRLTGLICRPLVNDVMPSTLIPRCLSP